MTTALTFDQQNNPQFNLGLRTNTGPAQRSGMANLLTAIQNANQMNPVVNIQPLAQPMQQPQQQMAQGQGPSFQFQDLNRAFQLDPRNTLANTLMQQGARGTPIRTPLEGIGRLSQSLVGAMLQKRALDRLEGQETAKQEQQTQNLQNLIGQFSPEMQPSIAALAPSLGDNASSVLAQSLMGQMFQEPDPVTTSELVTENVGGNTFAFVKETTNGSTNISNLQTIEKEDGEKTFTTAAILNYDQTKDLVTQNPGLMTVDSLNLGSSYSVELNEDQSIKKITEVKPEKVKVNQPVTDLGKLESDLTKGLITKEDYDTKKAIILGGLSEKDKFASENTISKRFQDNLQIKNLSNIIPIVRAAIATANVDTMAADLDLVFAVGKAFDPTSVVRGSEQVTIQKAASLPEQFKGIIRYVNGKGRLTPVQKADLINQVISRYKVHLDSGINYFEGEKSILKTRELNEKVLIMPSLIDPREINAIKNISADGQVVPFQITVNYPSVSGNDDSAYQELPSGSLYFGPDGQLRRKK
jgi:hypothetical protein